MIKNAVWTVDEYDVYNFHIETPQGFQVHAFIQKRPAYCDRGHYSFNVDGPFGLDGSDTFPRYYMDLNTAMLEATKWLNWRMYKIPASQQKDVTTEVYN